MMPITTSSGTSSPAFMYFWAASPISVPRAAASRSISPVEMCGSPYAATMRSAWVPLPAPGPPSRIDVQFAASTSPQRARAGYLRKPS